MAYEPTPQQQQAITTIQRDVAVAAGAGSGKTKVLVERFVYLLEQGIPLERIAAITFTRKAAQEMRDRVRSQLAEHPQLASLAPQMTHAQISTIHSLCQRIITEHPREAGVDPRFRLGEEWEMQGMLQDVAEDTLRARLDAGDSMITQIRESYRQLRDAAGMLVQIYNDMIGVGQRTFGSNQSEQDLQAVLPRAAAALEQSMRSLFGAWDAGTITPTEKQEQALAALRQQWQLERAALAAPAGLHIQDTHDVLVERCKGNWGRIKPLMDSVKDALAQWRQAWVDLEGHYQMVSWGEVLNSVHTAYQDQKRAAGLLDFNDLEALALELLQHEHVRQHYGFLHLMVDEFQDTNRVQKAIVDGLRTPSTTLFVVGDGKQSIYRFRNAEVQVFLETQQEIMNNGGQRILLDDNFRSLPALVDWTNTVFPYLMDGDQVPFEASRAGSPGSVPPHVEWMHIPKNDEVKQPLDDLRRVEAEQIARRIKAGMDQGTFAAGDVALLFRATTNMRIYEQALLAEDIPFVNVSGRGFHSTREVQDILYFLAWLEDADDEVAAAAVLRSPFFLVSDEGLYWYRQHRLEEAAPDDAAKICQAHDLYADLRRLAAIQPAPLVLRRLLESTEFCSRLAAGALGQQRVANVLKLEESSWELWAKGRISLQEQHHYIRQLLDGRDLEGEARLVGEEAQAVTLMTIHGAKGLEFNVVVLPDLNRQLNYGSQGAVLYHRSLGMAVKDTSLAQEIKALADQEQFEEYKRLLYVAVTRAEQKLILCGIGEDVDAAKPLSELKNWWQWLLRVRAEHPDLPFTPWEEAAPAAPLLRTEGQSRTSEPVRVQTVSQPPWQVQPPPAVPWDITRFSVTSLLLYDTCPRCFYYRHVLRVPEQPRGLERVVRPPAGVPGLDRPLPAVAGHLLPTQRGNIIHRVCEQIEDPEQLDQLLEQSLALEGTEVSGAERSNLRRMAQRYLASPSFARSRSVPLLREWPFLVPVDRFIITGTMDQVFLESDGAVIVDLKTNHIGPAQVPLAAAQYQLQLELYAWALTKLDMGPVKETQLHFLLPGTITSMNWQDSRMQELDQWVPRVCWEILERSEQGGQAFPAAPACQGSAACQRNFKESDVEVHES